MQGWLFQERRDEGIFFGAVWSGRGWEAMTVAARSELSRLRTTGLSAGRQSHRCVLTAASVLDVSDVSADNALAKL